MLEPTWTVRRSPNSRATPWVWECTTPVTTGLITKPCGKWGLARTRTAADEAGATHADTHNTAR